MKNWIIIGAFLAAVAVLFGAFGAHLLKSRLPTEDLTIFETGVRYQMYHKMACLRRGIVTLVSFIRVFSNVSSKRLPEKRHSHTGCICLTLLHCAFSNDSSNCLHLRMHIHIGCIC